jgi:hypothetical protein
MFASATPTETAKADKSKPECVDSVKTTSREYNTGCGHCRSWFIRIDVRVRLYGAHKLSAEEGQGGNEQALGARRRSTTFEGTVRSVGACMKRQVDVLIFFLKVHG